MSSRKRQWLKQTGTGLIILLMGIMLLNKAAYTHVHILPDGSLHTHAHPFSNHPEGKKTASHQHSSLEIFLLDLQDVLLLSALSVSVLRFSNLPTVFRERYRGRLLPARVQASPGRAPPVCM